LKHWSTTHVSLTSLKHIKIKIQCWVPHVFFPHSTQPAAAALAGVSARPACHDRRLSVARWVTPYGREAHWFSANTAALPLLSSAEAVAGALVGDGDIFGEKFRECSLQCLTI
jgi:hypothetical protein